MFVLPQLIHHDVCDAPYTAQRIVGQKNHKSQTHRPPRISVPTANLTELNNRPLNSLQLQKNTSLQRLQGGRTER